jgi:hypothetical protein
MKNGVAFQAPQPWYDEGGAPVFPVQKRQPDKKKRNFRCSKCTFDSPHAGHVRMHASYVHKEKS